MWSRLRSIRCNLKTNAPNLRRYYVFLCRRLSRCVGLPQTLTSFPPAHPTARRAYALYTNSAIVALSAVVVGGTTLWYTLSATLSQGQEALKRFSEIQFPNSIRSFG